MTANLDYEYDQYLKQHEAVVAESVSRFGEQLEKNRFHYGRFTIPSFYKAFFLSPKQVHLLKRVVATLSQAINNAVRLYFEESHFSHVYRLPEEVRELVKIDPGYSQHVVFSRFNMILEGESLKVLEVNCDSPVGAAYADHVETLFLEEPCLQEFFSRYHFVRSDRAQGMLNALLAAYEQFGGYETPNIGILDWRFTRMAHECQMMKEFFESKGYKSTVADPRELQFKGGKLYHKNFRIHLIYRRVLFDEILEHFDEVQDLIKAYRARAVCMVNSLRSRIASTKALLSILTNPQFNHFFDENENRIRQEHIPWTRRLVDAEDFYGGKKAYLIDFLKDEKESLVLKPASSFGGRGVAIGRETRDPDWNATMDKALKGDWVVQEYINIPIMTVPTMINNKLDFAYKKHNFNALVFGGKYCGGFTRLSDESVINVARGGGIIPVLATESVSAERFGAT